MAEIQTSDLIASVALVIAGLAALYARWTANAAEQANTIAIHNERLKIYKALLDFKALLSARGPRFPENDLWNFYEPVQLSEFYFGEAIYSEMKQVWDNGQKILSLSDSWKQAKENGDPKYRDLVKEAHDLHRKTRGYCKEVAEDMKPTLRIGKA